MLITVGWLNEPDTTMQPACHAQGAAWHWNCSHSGSPRRNLGINMSESVSRGRAWAAPVCLALCACSAQTSVHPAPTSLEPIATLQELMQSEVDASADNIWDAVETSTGPGGEEHKQPHKIGRAHV